MLRYDAWVPDIELVIYTLTSQFQCPTILYMSQLYLQFPYTNSVLVFYEIIIEKKRKAMTQDIYIRAGTGVGGQVLDFLFSFLFSFFFFHLSKLNVQASHLGFIHIS